MLRCNGFNFVILKLTNILKISILISNMEITTRYNLYIKKKTIWSPQ